MSFVNKKRVLSFSDKDVSKNKDIAAASYLWILSVFVLFLRKESHFIQFHARQATFLFFVSVLFWIIPVVRYLDVIVFALMVVGFIEAVHGNYYRIPIVADIVERKISYGNTWQKFMQGVYYTGDIVRRIFRAPKGIKSREQEIKSAISQKTLVKQLDEIEKNITEERKLVRQIKEKMGELKNY